MTQKAFYEALLGFSDLKINSIEKTAQKIVFYCALKSDTASCPNCMQTTKKVNQTATRKVQDLKISGREVWLYIAVKQFYFASCPRFFMNNPN